MIKCWRHKEYDFDKGMYPLSLEFDEILPEKEVFSELAPSDDYYEYLDVEGIIYNKVKHYPKKRVAGIMYSDTMNARLDMLSVAFFTDEQMTALKHNYSTDEAGVLEHAKDEIDTKFEKVQLFLEGGKWKSAKRQIKKVTPGIFLDQKTIDEIKDYIFDYVKNNY